MKGFSFKAMDRHADKSARDDRKTSNAKNPNHTTQAAVFSSDFWGFQAVGAGILLGVNEQAHRAESTKSAEKTTRQQRRIKWKPYFYNSAPAFETQTTSD